MRRAGGRGESSSRAARREYPGRMITRVSEAVVKPGKLDEFTSRLHELVGGFPVTYDGLIDHEVLIDLDDPLRIQYVSRWRDEEALAGFGGATWRSDPVTFPGETELLVQPLTLRHFTS